MTHARGVLLLSLLATLAVAADDPRKVAASAKAYRALTDEYNAAVDEFQKAYQAARTAEEKLKVYRDKHLSPAAFAPRYLKVALAHPRSPAAVDCLLWVAEHPVLPPGPPDKDPRVQALALLQTDYVQDERLGRLCTQLVYSVDEASEEFLRTVLGKATLPGVQARACASLAANLKHRGRLIRQLRDEAVRKEYEAAWGKPAIAALLQRDADKVLARSVRLFQRVIDNHGDVKHPTHGTLANLAKAHIASIRKPIDVDQPAPEIDQPDIADRPLKLSDLRGKVVLIDFWSHTFPACRGAYEYERGLVQRLAGRPFVLLGVNGDADRKAAQKVMADEKLTWRSWWDGGTSGPLAVRWEIHLWPGVVLIDHKGAVRGVYSGWPDRKILDAEIDRLVKAAEAR